jgi:hypothetical protein
MVFYPDTDGDGLRDDVDACPGEDATGFDADRDGCIDSFSGLGDLIATLVASGAGIDPRMETSLLAKVENALAKSDRDNVCAAVHGLAALRNQVLAQTGKKVSPEAADAVIAYAESLMAWLETQLPEGDSCA